MNLATETVAIGPEGRYGSASANLDSNLVVTASVSFKVDIIAELEKLSAKSATPIDDAVVKYIKEFVAAANAVMPAST